LKNNRNNNRKPQTRVNEQIRTRNVRLIGSEGENLDIIPTDDALKMARDLGLDLIEINPNAEPPIAKIQDYGKFQYDQKKKQKQNKVHRTETKTIQVKPGTGEHDLEMKAKKTDKWLQEGHRVKFDLFLRGRAKYMDKDFLETRMERLMKLLTTDYKIADGPKKSPKGLTVILEKEK
jgi:translation initiation factor IF-3